MNCKIFLRLLDSDSLEGNPAAAEHLEECERCREVFERWRAAQKELTAMKEVEIPFSIHSRIMANVRSPGKTVEARRTVSFWRRNTWALPAAAVLLVVLIGGATMLTFFRRGVMKPVNLSAPVVQAPRKAMIQEEASNGSATRAGREATGIPAPHEKAGAEDELPSPPLNQKQPTIEHPLEISPDLSSVSKSQKRPPAPLFLGRPSLKKTIASAPKTRGRMEISRKETAAASMKKQAAPMREAEAAQGAVANVPIEEPTVLCTLATLDNSRYFAFQLRVNAAPPAGASWYATVRPGGAIGVSDSTGKPLRNPSRALLYAIANLKLQPGRYKLSRVGD